MKRLRWRLLGGAAAVAAAAAMMAPSAAFAQGGPPPGHGGTETGNNLSVPTIFVGANPFSLTCSTTATLPQGDPQNGFPIDPALYYYVQGVNTWQAACVNSATSATADAAWGDNLTGDAALVVNHPIRVEMALNDTATTDMTGFNVYKLEPNTLDRLSPYGTPATGTPTTGFTSNPVTFSHAGVWTANATWKIYNKATPTATVFSGPATAEINATGRVVYGYNLTVSSAGTYVIEFTVPSGVTLNSADAGSIVNDGHTAYLEITVTASHGGGRGSHGHPGGR